MGGERREIRQPISERHFKLDTPSAEQRNSYLSLFPQVQIPTSNGNGHINGIRNRDSGVRLVGISDFCGATVGGYGPSSYDHREQRPKSDYYRELCHPERGCALARLKRDQGVNGFIVSGDCCEPCNGKTS